MTSDARRLVLVVTDNEVILVLHVLAVNLNLWHDAVTFYIGLLLNYNDVVALKFTQY